MLESDDRRRQVKSANRRAILDAAAALAEERGLGHFTVKDLAERAGVSRRTIFNHFASVDDAVYARLSELLGVVVDDFVEIADATPLPATPSTGAVFEQLADVIERTALVRSLSHIARLVGTSEDHPATVLWRHEVLQSVTARLTAEVTRRNPQSDPFTVALLAGSLINAMIVTFEQWERETGAADTPGSRRVWQRLLRTAVEHLRHGFAG
ncbi:TetR family transcriptional regulator [Kocuria sabuli]|uniref:TetR family transcriptional regulator n=1 Tax=Kocuria sabuli TaxID=3071448 RepID=UPI0034D79F59